MKLEIKVVLEQVLFNTQSLLSWSGCMGDRLRALLVFVIPEVRLRVWLIRDQVDLGVLVSVLAWPPF